MEQLLDMSEQEFNEEVERENDGLRKMGRLKIE